LPIDQGIRWRKAGAIAVLVPLFESLYIIYIKGQLNQSDNLNLYLTLEPWPSLQAWVVRLGGFPTRCPLLDSEVIVSASGDWSV